MELTRSFTQSLTCSFTHSLVQSLIHSLTRSFTYSLTRSFTYSLTYSLTLSLIHSLTRSLTHYLTIVASLEPKRSNKRSPFCATTTNLPVRCAFWDSNKCGASAPHCSFYLPLGSSSSCSETILMC